MRLVGFETVFPVLERKRITMSRISNKMRVPVVFAIVLVLLALVSCILQTPEPEATAPADTPVPPTAAPTISSPTATTAAAVASPSGSVTRRYSSPPAMALDPNSDYVADFRTNQGNFRVRLFAGQTPVTVNNFVFPGRRTTSMTG